MLGNSGLESSRSGGLTRGEESDKQLLLPTRSNIGILGLCLCIILLDIIGGIEGAHHIPQPLDVWVEWANRTGQKDFCLSLQTTSSPFRTCLIGYPDIRHPQWEEYGGNNACFKRVNKTFMSVIRQEVKDRAEITQCLLKTLNVSLTWDPPELDILGSQEVGNETWTSANN